MDIQILEQAWEGIEVSQYLFGTWAVIYWFTSSCHKRFKKFGICIDIVEVWFGIDNGQISSIFDSIICPPHDSGGVLLTRIASQLQYWSFIQEPNTDLSCSVYIWIIIWTTLHIETELY